MSKDDVRKILDDGRGTMFDPVVLNAFFEVLDGR
jgi:response regulator RpfG family c-di-GMP phosphodiesterase